MTQQVYRLRSAKHLIGTHEELRKQEIYFAPPHELNDPMEGFRDIVWKGDAIVWENLFRNYISCLNLTVILAKLRGDDSVIDPEQIPIEGLADNHETPMAVEILDELCANVFRRCKIHGLIQDLANTSHAVRRDELLIYLKHIHYTTLEEIQNIHVRHGMAPEEARPTALKDPPAPPENLPSLIQRLYEEQPEVARSALAALFSVSNLMFENMNVIHKYNTSRQKSGAATPARLNHNFVALDFPRIYLTQLPRILYPDWYVACFLEDCRNSSVWAHYGDNHKGACLIFDATEDSGQLRLELKHITGSSSHRDRDSGKMTTKPTWGYSSMPLYNVGYQEELRELDFFRSIGALPTGRLLSRWYTDNAGNRSICSDHIGSGDEDSWRNAYWKKFYQDITIKSQDWAYEKEIRVVLSSSFSDLTEKTARKLTYRFPSLRGVIFGINMTDEEKMEIIDIVFEKCRKEKRDYFEFYQAYYSHETNSIERYKLNIKIPQE